MDGATEPTPPPLSPADQSLLRAAMVWGRDPGSGFWRRFRDGRREALSRAWEDDPPGNAALSLDRLRREHAAQARPDLSRVHVSWWVRALQGEPRSVRAAVVGNLPAGIAEALRDGLKLKPEEIRPDRPPSPGALRVALALWTERLVGDLAERAEDPPVIVALTRFDNRTVSRLIRMSGLAKWSLTGSPLPAPGAGGRGKATLGLLGLGGRKSRKREADPKDVARLDRLRSMLAALDPRFVGVAANDIEAALAVKDEHPEARLGLVTVARLLVAADPHRVRWALQHLPYQAARSVRPLMGEVGKRAPMLARLEASILRSAWTLLHEEGRLNEPWPWGDRP
jgi:hypothetical protein